MDLDWSDGGLIILISLIPIVIALFSSLNQFFKTKAKHAFFMAMIWFFLTLAGWLQVQNKVLDIPNHLESRMATIWAGVSIILLTDSISPPKFGKIRILIIFFIATIELALYFCLYTFDTSYLNPNPAQVTIYSWFQDIYFISLGLIGLVLIYYLGRIYFNAPTNLKKTSAMGVIGGILMGIINPIVIGMQLPKEIPGINWVISSISCTLIALAFLRPELAYILPFKVESLFVLHTGGGIELYSHFWDHKKRANHKYIFTSMVHGVCCLLKESIKRGEVKKIDLEHGTMVIHQGIKWPVAYILITSKPSIALREGLAKFAEKFEATFDLSEDFNPVSKFNISGKFITECFPFIPVYENKKSDKTKKKL